MGENAGRLMLLDTAALYFRAFFGVPDRFRAPDGTSVNAARGLLDMIARLTEAYEPDRIIACWDDDWRPAWRVDLIPTYKEHRVVEEVAGAPDVEEAPDALRAQVPVIREYLGLLGIPVVGAAEHEADDVIGTLATRHEHVDVVTGDRDLFQLIDDPADVRIIYTARGMSNLEVVTGDVVEGEVRHHRRAVRRLRNDARRRLRRPARREGRRRQVRQPHCCSSTATSGRSGRPPRRRPG